LTEDIEEDSADVSEIIDAPTELEEIASALKDVALKIYEETPHPVAGANSPT
jgi:hypothetical protein